MISTPMTSIALSSAEPNDLQIELLVTEMQVTQGTCQLVNINLTLPKSLPNQGSGSFIDRIQPAELATLQLPSELDFSRGIILYGWAPTWLYAHLTARCQAAAWVACCSVNLPKHTAVVVSSRVDGVQTGDLVTMALKPKQGTVILIGGPPDSGKSVFAYALQRSLRQYFLQHDPSRKVFLHRANWDGEGNWAHEMAPDAAKALVDQYGQRPHLIKNNQNYIQRYFQSQAATTANIRDLVDVVLVDVGGRVQDEKLPLVEACTHSIVISCKPERVSEWQVFCGDRGLQPLAVIHSVEKDQCLVVGNDGFLEVKAGRWERGKTEQVPGVILRAVIEAIG
jgi:CRISPR-associated protein Csx3